MTTFSEINDRTGFANGETFDDADAVREYFSPDAQRSMFGDDAVTDADVLTEWADEVIAHGWHVAKQEDGEMKRYEVTYRPDETRNNVSKYPPTVVAADSPSEAIEQVADPEHMAAWEFAERPGGFVMYDPEDAYGYYLAVEIN